MDLGRGRCVLLSGFLSGFFSEFLLVLCGFFVCILLTHGVQLGQELSELLRVLLRGAGGFPSRRAVVLCLRSFFWSHVFSAAVLPSLRWLLRPSHGLHVLYPSQRASRVCDFSVHARVVVGLSGCKCHGDRDTSASGAGR